MSNKLVVLDANFYWAEQLFSAYKDYADILLLRPVDFRTFRRRYNGYFIDTTPKKVDVRVWEQRICCPPGWLFHYWPLTQRLLKLAIQKFQGDDNLTFVFSYPYYAALAEALNTYCIYYAIDDYQEYWPGRQAQTVAQEGYAISVADLTLCAAQYRLKYFQKRYSKFSSRILHIPHGCSKRFMVEEVLPTPNPLPDSLLKYKRPIAGYVGALNYRFDFSFLADVASQLHDVTFLLGGSLPTKEDGSAAWWHSVCLCKKLSNVHFIGYVPHQKLGDYLQSFDVLLMLYSDCNFNVNACPTKLWDYMGTSRPIVANSAVPEVLLWRDVIRIAKTPQQYAVAVRASLNNSTWKAEERLKIAEKHGWGNQADRLHEFISSQSSVRRIWPEEFSLHA